MEWNWLPVVIHHKPINTCRQRETSIQVSKSVMKISSQVLAPLYRSKPEMVFNMKHWIFIPTDRGHLGGICFQTKYALHYVKMLTKMAVKVAKAQNSDIDQLWGSVIQNVFEILAPKVKQTRPTVKIDPSCCWVGQNGCQMSKALPAQSLEREANGQQRMFRSFCFLWFRPFWRFPFWDLHSLALSHQKKTSPQILTGLIGQFCQ